MRLQNKVWILGGLVTLTLGSLGCSEVAFQTIEGESFFEAPDFFDPDQPREPIIVVPEPVEPMPPISEEPPPPPAEPPPVVVIPPPPPPAEPPPVVVIPPPPPPAEPPPVVVTPPPPPPVVVTPPPPPPVEPPPAEPIPPIAEEPPPAPPSVDACDFGPDPVFDICEKQIRCWVQRNRDASDPAVDLDNMQIFFSEDSARAWARLDCPTTRSNLVFEIRSGRTNCEIAHYGRKPNYITQVWQSGRCR